MSIQKVRSLSKKEEAQRNFFIVAVHLYYL